MRDEIDAMLSKLNEAAEALSDSVRHGREVDAIRRAAEYIKRHEAATLNPEPTETEPTLEECVAAINRRPEGVAGITGWKIHVSAKGFATRIKLSLKEVKAMGKLLIARERAAESKGGA